MSSRPTIFEAMDSCRWGTDDLSQPEMRELAERLQGDPQLQQEMARLQQFDSQVSRVMQDVPVSESLADRLLAAVAAGPAASVDQQLPATETVSGAANAERQSGRRSWRWLSIAASLLVLVSVSFAANYFLRSPTAISEDQWARKGLAWADDIDHAGWQEMVPDERAGRLVRELGLSTYPRRSQSFGAGRFDDQATIYDLSRPGQPTALLLVVGTPDQPSVGPILPVNPIRMTRGFSVGICHRGQQLYILLVEGSPNRYRRFFNQPRIG